MRKQVKQGRCRVKVDKTTKHRKPSNQQINGETLRSAVSWVVHEKSFENLKFHGNTTWLVCDLIVLAVLWVWSDHATLTGAFAVSIRRSRWCQELACARIAKLV